MTSLDGNGQEAYSVVSELMRDDPDAEVLAWARTVAPADLSNCLVTVKGTERGPAAPAGGGVWLSRL